MAGTLNKGSLVKGTGGSGGGGSASFPIVVTDSGSSLPSASGYQLNDTFLNTTDKKIYKTEETITGYSISADVSNGVDVDLTTGIATGFETTGSGPYVYKAISKDSGGVGWVGDNKEYKIHFKLTSVPTANTNYLIYGEHSLLSDSDAYFSIRIANKKLNLRLNVRKYGSNTLLDEKDLCSTELTSGIEYYLKVVKNGNSASVTLATDGYDENIIDENTIETQDLANSLPTVQYGYPTKNGGTNSWSLGTSFTIGQIYLGDSTGNLVTPTTALSWDSGTDLTDKTEYADKTNGILYLYENSELNAIPNLEDYKKKAETITIDTASVTIANVQANKNYVFSNSAITDITLSGCETSFEETSIEFTLPADISNFSFTDNSGITWVDGSPTFNASKSYLIVIFNKLGFVKEY